MAELGERMAALAASFEAEKNYQHDRWHKLDNDLTPVINLPERLTREIGKIQGVMEGRLLTVTKELERSMEAAINKAVKPITEDIAVLKRDVDQLKLDAARWTGGKLFGVWLLQTAVSAITAVLAVKASMGH